MLEVKIQSEEGSDGYEISSCVKGNATTIEIKAVIKSMLKGLADSTDEEIVICALEEYVKERLGIK